MIQIALNAVVSTLSTIFWAKTSLMNKILGCFAWWLHILNLITFHLNHLSINYEILVPLSLYAFFPNLPNTANFFNSDGSKHSYSNLTKNANAAPSASPLPAAPCSDHNFSSNEADQSGPGQTDCCWRTNYCNFCSPSSPHPSLVPLCFKFPFSTWLIPSTLNKMFSFCPMSCWELARDLKLN